MDCPFCRTTLQSLLTDYFYQVAYWNHQCGQALLSPISKDLLFILTKLEKFRSVFTRYFCDYVTMSWKNKILSILLKDNTKLQFIWSFLYVSDISICSKIDRTVFWKQEDNIWKKRISGRRFVYPLIKQDILASSRRYRMEIHLYSCICFPWGDLYLQAAQKAPLMIFTLEENSYCFKWKKTSKEIYSMTSIQQMRFHEGDYFWKGLQKWSVTHTGLREKKKKEMFSSHWNPINTKAGILDLLIICN